MLNKSLIILSYILILLSSRGHALSFDRYVCVDSLTLPATPFYGSMTVRANSDKEWYCVFGADCVLEVKVWDNDKTADYGDFVTNFKLYSVNNGDARILAERRLRTVDPVRAVKVLQNQSGLRFYASGGIDVFDKDEPLSPLAPNTKVRILVADRKEYKGLKNDFESYPYRVFSMPDTLTSDKNTPEGEWLFLDKVTPRDSSVQVGNRYRLVILADEPSDNGYVIVSLSDTFDSLDKTSFIIKGYLKPTAFKNHFDLIWYDSDGFEAGVEGCNATLEGPNLLTLDFPVLGAQMRFQRYFLLNDQ